MKYLCLICAEKVMEDMSEADARKHYQEYAEFTEGIKKSGRFIGANRLKPASSATTIRVRNNKVEVTDGPFAETKEQLGGYYIIEAKDLNDAIQVASKIPGARFGCVELRPIAEDVQTRALGFDTQYSPPRRPEKLPR
ncbi:MAG: YciI family protein [Phycisphaerales bacterium]|nr:YciI family protein [Phycisphaerales bacterium]MCI0630819.1 YciI family protein [Phycisphaerales bacterium]MCI0674475.1 YciI family protein [Phycisphaerales bacterium]